MDDGDDPSKEEIQVSPAKDQDQEKLKRKNDEEEVDIGGSASSTGTSKKKKRGCCVDIPSSESDEEDWAPTPTREDNQPNRNMMVDDTEGRITLDIEDWRPEVLTVCPSSPDTDSP
ncbi:hypothetical protein DAI22_10g072501 [Oryza sativa Japonica Group]|nr:uncharacterized protein LOC107278983 isoform X3 [Oryza sativa Japonica Group]KAF2913280.1 hypothetical protein DAI22_10g072501 [Oryza sativa Japonica Group]